ncbi:hypothetical protein PXK00_12450 [Phaeobacter sp. QD34_3]|uniref:hypothetical protein n=1 Tax=unclassified Phaeobacter TaxID=2621772 RepID=UPI00237F4E8D|nr:MULTISPECIES: hypothetical protein [unclassified Phaeobacter]MDE4133925.1 hypothetical protein [Phaeobacter sp. QD34_3]MDE4137618.1 hypothetical protein [Phaeobacter sp. QD34_24]MDE4175631.1 hypothetical protein [Phaeobacter sp. PT47_59]
MLTLLAFVARHGRAALVLGLLAGLLLPDLARLLRPWIPQLVALLLFLTAFRIGARAALGGLADGLSSLRAVLVLQLALPLAALLLFWLIGIETTPAAIAILLMLSAPSVTGSPNITLLLGHAPEPAFRVLVLGTALMPLTIIPVFLLAPSLGGLQEVIWAALRLTGAIGVTVAAAWVLRRATLPDLRPDQVQALDGLTTLALAVIVVGLMSALGPALQSAPMLVAKWMALVLVANLGLQLATYRLLRWQGHMQVAVPYAIVAGNRNFALFLIALPASTTDQLLIFLGCYQVPMYLTAVIMRRLYAPVPADQYSG